MKAFEVPLLFDRKPTWPALLDPPSLPYTVNDYAPAKGRSPQPILRDRRILKPIIDLNKYRCRAVLDWIEIQLDTPNEHQAVNVRRTAVGFLKDVGSSSSVFVTGLTRTSPYIGSKFILRIQQPNPHEIIPFCKKLVGKYDPDRKSVRDMPITAIEVSVDFYVKNHKALSTDALNLLRWQMTEVLKRHLKPAAALTEKESNHPRFFTGTGGSGSAKPLVASDTRQVSAKQRAEINRLNLSESILAPLRIGAHRQAPIDTTYYIGKKASPVMLRVMDKITDQRDPVRNIAVDLSPAERRSRIEVTLLKETDEVGGPAAVDLNTLKDLFGFSFKPIRKLVFEFFYPTINKFDEMSDLPFPVNITELAVFERSGVYGLDRAHRSIAEINKRRYQERELPTERVKIGSKGKAMSFEEMNRKIDRAMTKLSKDWMRP